MQCEMATEQRRLNSTQVQEGSNYENKDGYRQSQSPCHFMGGAS